MRARPRILLLVTLSEWGGAQHVVYLLATHLRARYDVTVGCAPGGELVRRLRQDGVPVVEIPGLRRLPTPWQDARVLWRLYRLMRRGSFDLVHAHSTKAGLLGRLAANLVHVPAVLFTAHGWAFTEGRAWWKRRILALYERLMAALTTKIICVSRHDRELALCFGVARPQKLVVIHNGLVAERFAEIDREQVRSRLGIGEAPVIAFVGRLAVPKDPMTLLVAVKEVPAAQLLVVGDGPLRMDVERAIERDRLHDRVSLLGERSDVPEILAAADVFVLSSLWEGLPLTIIEAMMAGLPVVATRVGGVPELVEDGLTGFLVPPKDPQALSKVLRRLVEDRDLRQRMGHAGLARARKEFTLERMVAETERQYEMVLRHAHG